MFMSVLVPVDLGCPCSWRYRQLQAAWCGTWKSNLGSPEWTGHTFDCGPAPESSSSELRLLCPCVKADDSLPLETATHTVSMREPWQPEVASSHLQALAGEPGVQGWFCGLGGCSAGGDSGHRRRTEGLFWASLEEPSSIKANHFVYHRQRNGYRG